jgi:hypothetical protein
MVAQTGLIGFTSTNIAEVEANESSPRYPARCGLWRVSASIRKVKRAV